MKNAAALSILIFLFMLSFCGRETDVVTLEKGSPAYTLGKELSSILPTVHPDSNRVLITSNIFNLSTGEVLDFFKSNFGNRADDLKNMDEQQLSAFIQRTATQLAEKKLLLIAAKKAKVKASSSEVERILNGQYERSGGKEAFIAFLNENGVDYKFVENDVKNSVIINGYLTKIVDDGITEEQINEAYQSFIQDTTVSVRHILLLTQEKTDAEKKDIHKRMEDILTRARAGEDFAELAGTFSEDPGSKENGGLYENFSRGTMVKPFEDAAFNVPVGEISDIVETRYGYHILKVVERNTGEKSLDEARPELMEKLREHEWQLIVPAHIEALKEEAEVEIVTL
jgi:parvulin-like peptidyl-prolyl isomerase